MRRGGSYSNQEMADLRIILSSAYGREDRDYVIWMKRCISAAQVPGVISIDQDDNR